MSGPEFVHEEILILTKTYPSPSLKYRETTCVAGVNRAGELRRVFPVPFRLLQGESRFHRWEWVGMKLFRKADARPESRKVELHSITRSGNVIDTSEGWRKRLEWTRPHIVSDFDSLEARRQLSGETLGFLEPSRCIELQITPVDEPDWTEDEIRKLEADGLFDSPEVRSRTSLRKLPYDFHYRYECETPEGPKMYRHKVTDWEFGALYWNCMKSHGPAGWESAFRDKVEKDFFSARKLLFLFGTVHRFPGQWLIVGVIYPPKPPKPVAELQLDLL